MITIEKNEFLKALQIVKSTADKSALNPILTTVHIKSENGGLTLTCTNIDSASRMSVSANITDNINVCVNVDKLTQIVSVLDNLITLTVDGAVLLIKSGKTSYKLLVQNPIDFPQVDFKETDNKIILSKDNFIKAISQTGFAVLQDQHNILSGINIAINDNNFEFAATDGNRLCCCKFDGKIGTPQQCSVQPKILGEFVKHANNDVTVFIDTKNIVLKADNMLLKTVLLNGTFPDYNKLIPMQFENNIEINKNQLLKSLEKVAILMDERTAIIKLDFTDNKLQITAQSMEETAKDEIEVDFSDELQIAFNGKYLIEGLKAMKDETITIKTNGALAACLFDGDYRYLLMPINVG